MADPGQPDQLGVAAEDQVAQRPAGEVRGADPVADVAAGPRRARCRGRGPTEAHQSRGMPSAPPHAWVTRVPAQHREQVEQRRVQRAKTRSSRSNSGRIREPEVVRRAAAAEDEPVVGGALAVDDQVAVVGERLAAAQPDLRPRAAAASGSVAMISE